MSWRDWRPRPPLPLLRRELAQQAARRRTYALRLLYGAALLAVFVTVYQGQQGHIPVRDSRGVLLGAGRELVYELSWWMLLGVYLVQPALMAGALAGERQAGTLDLLRVSGMRPMAMVLQKLFARLLPMVSAQLLALPLLASAYALGGLGRGELRFLVSLQVLAVAQVGAIGLYASAVCRTPLRALAQTVLLLGGLWLAAVVVGGITGVRFWPPTLLSEMQHTPPTIATGAPLIRASLWALALCAAGFVALAAEQLSRSAVATGKGWLERLFERLDIEMEALNRSVTGGVKLLDGAQTLPDDAPVAWRTTSRGPLGQPQYLFRISLVVLLPVLLVCGIQVMRPSGFGRIQVLVLSQAMAGVWALVIVGGGAVAASAIAAERERQTLDVLLTTPLAGRRLVAEWMRGVRRVLALAWPPLGLLILTEARVERPVDQALAWGYLLGAVVGTAIALEAVGWVGMACGLALRRRGQAVGATLATLILWTLTTPLLAGLLGPSLPAVARRVLVVLSPAASLALLELESSAGLGPAALHLALLAIGIWALRRAVLQRADRLLGRAVG